MADIVQEEEPSTGIHDIKNAILSGRNLVEAYLADHTSSGADHEKIDVSLTTLKDGLVKLGFKDLQDFYNKNKELNFAEIDRCYDKCGTCDGCKDKTRGCFNTCYETRTDKLELSADRTSLIGCAQDFLHWRHCEGNSPPGCSMYFQLKSTITGPAFDIYWGMEASDITTDKYDSIKAAEVTK